MFTGKWQELRRKRYLKRNGTEGYWEYAVNVDPAPRQLETCGVDAFSIYKKQLITVTVFRYPLNSYCLEVPSGRADASDTDPKDVATRELKEETGYTAGPEHCELMGDPLPVDPWKSTETSQFVVVQVPDSPENAQPMQNLEADEVIAVHLFPIEDLLSHVQRFCEEHQCLLDVRLYLFALGLAGG